MISRVWTIGPADSLSRFSVCAVNMVVYVCRCSILTSTTFICKQILVTKSLHLLHTTMGGGCIHTLPWFKLNLHLLIVCQKLLVQCMQMDLHTGPQMVTRKFFLPRWQQATAAQPDSTIKLTSSTNYNTITGIVVVGTFSYMTIMKLGSYNGTH